MSAVFILQALTIILLFRKPMRHKMGAQFLHSLTYFFISLRKAVSSFFIAAFDAALGTWI
jgi:hypothetical protein